MFLAHASGEHAPAPRLGTFGRGFVQAMTSREHPPRHLERRWATRYSFRAELEIEWGSAVLRGKTRDIGSNGMFIESADTLWVGAGFTARLALGRPVGCPGELTAVPVIYGASFMTRCLDCGSERTTDQCPSCGLTTAAAELMFRRRLMRQTGIFLLGSLAFPYISQIYPPLDLDLILVFFGLVFFGALTLAVILERRARNHQEIELLKRVYNGFVPLPWILAATLFVNGRLDSQKNVVYYPTVVVGRFNMKGIVKGSRRLVVRSWREGQRVERLAVDMDDFDRFHEGDAIVVGVGPGALGIPWYYGAYRR